MSRRTKIVATLGPASEDPAVISAMVHAGVDVVRLNLSHGTIEDHLARLQTVRSVAEQVGRPIGVLADLPGPKLRAGRFPEGGSDIAPAATVRFVPGPGTSTADRISVDYPTLLDDVEPGDRIVIGDGDITLLVTAKDSDAIVAEVQSGGRTQGSPGVHLSCERLQMFAPTVRDLELAEAIAAAGVEYVALSFVRRAADVLDLRAVVGDRAAICAKIETASALADLAGIIAAADAVMVARGDLGIDCPLEDVPHLQKQIIRQCVSFGRPAITATQMLESMTHAPAPTRAEVSDVANAVFDGTSAVMLSGETAIGDDPVAVVAAMSRIAARAETEASYRQWAERLAREQRSWEADTTSRITGAVSHAAWQAAIDAGASAILCCTRSGRTARAMARFRPDASLIGLSPDPRTVRALSLVWGVEPVHVEEYRSSDEMVWFAIETALTNGLIDHGDIVLVLAGAPDRTRGAATDILRVVEVE